MLRSLGALGLSCVLLTGCIDPQKRAEIAEEAERKKDLDVRVVSDVGIFDNTGPMKVHGVGLVTGLQGTGHSPPGLYRNMMEQFLLKTRGPSGGFLANEAKGESVQKILDNPNNCIVIVSGSIPPGARKGDRFDVDITLPDGSKATSLAGGHLHLSLLRVYEAASNLSQRHEGSNQLIGGHVFAHAKGPLVVGFGNNADANELKKGKVWQGGESRIHRPFALVMKHDDKSVKVANAVAERLDFMFRDDPRARAHQRDYNENERHIQFVGALTGELNQRHDPTGMTQAEMAKAASKDIINVRVPFAYRFNHERFLHVANVTPLNAADPKMTAYRQRLQKMLLDPRDTILTARRLEALGRDSIPILKSGLESDHPLVRFASAEALAYLGSTLGVEALTDLAQKHPILAKNCTTALADLGENICRDKLGNLLASDDRALRCAAFHALTLLDEKDSHLGGQLLNDVFWLYRVPQAGSPMVYYSTNKRPQVVLFGRNIELAPDTRVMVGDFTVVQQKEDGKIHVKRITARTVQPRPVVCSHRLDEVLAALTDLGASYQDVVEFLRKADANCPIVNWQIPEVTLAQIIEAGRQMRPGR